MIFESKQTVNGRSVWSVDTDKLTVTHITKTGENEQHSFWHDCVKYHLHYCEEYYPERLQNIPVASFSMEKRRFSSNSGNTITASIGTAIALVLAYFDLPLIVVALSASLAAWISGLIIL